MKKTTPENYPKMPAHPARDKEYREKRVKQIKELAKAYRDDKTGVITPYRVFNELEWEPIAMFDRYGIPVHPHMKSVLEADELKATIHGLENAALTAITSELHSQFTAFGDGQYGKLVSTLENPAVANMVMCIKALAEALPWCICLRCLGEGCELCQDRGFLYQWEFTSIPVEYLPERCKEYGTGERLMSW